MKEKHRRHTAICLFGLLSLGSGGMAHSQSQVSGSTAQGDSVTFYRDVLPIFQDSCQVCHRPGQIGSFSMLRYDETRPYARAIKRRVLKREMPPWFADPAVGHFANDPSLPPEQIEKIVRWVDSGAQAGNPKDAPAPVAWSDGGWTIAPDMVVKGPEYLVPKSGVLDWMYMAMPMNFERDTWVTSMEMRPGKDASITHHYCVYVVPKLKDVKYGVPSTSPADFGVGAGDGFDGCYETGQGPFDYRPYQAGRLIPANSDMIFQMHYNPQGKQAVLDQPQIGFTIAKSPPPRQFVFQNIGSGRLIDIAPREANYKAPLQEAELTVDTEIVWMQGHAHYRAKEMRFTIAYADGRVEPALHLNWNPFWQQIYYPTEPIVAPKGTVLQIEGWYDNSTRNRFNPDPDARVPFGLQATEEMLFPTFGFVVDGSFDTKAAKVIKPTPRADASYTVIEKPAGAAVASR
jgi:hypothetical protein